MRWGWGWGGCYGQPVGFTAGGADGSCRSLSSCCPGESRSSSSVVWRRVFGTDRHVSVCKFLHFYHICLFSVESSWRRRRQLRRGVFGGGPSRGARRPPGCGCATPSALHRVSVVRLPLHGVSAQEASVLSEPLDVPVFLTQDGDLVLEQDGV